MRTIHFSSLEVPPHQAHLHLTRLREANASSPHRHDFYEAFLVLEGQGWHHLNGRCLPLAKGDLVGIRPQDAHWFSTDKDQCLGFVNLAVSAALWQSFHTVLGLDPWLLKSLEVTLHPAETQRLAHELDQIAKSEDPLALLRVLNRIREFLTQPGDHSTDPPPAWLEALRRELAERAEALVEPVGYWQKRSGRSPEHLARSCRRYYGITFSELLNRARIERAKFLLRNTDEKVTTIAFDCGYGNLANFHRVFARLTGRTPNAWRRLGRATVPL
jgi:AraC family transcriptional regulator, dual regulator of chb operon